MNIICDLSTFNGLYPEADKYVMRNSVKIPLWSGKCILSYIIPKNINLTMPNGLYDSYKDSKDNNDTKSGLLKKHNNDINLVEIINGEISKGTFDKSLFTKT